MKCHQREVRERLALEDPRPVMQSLDGCAVLPVPHAQVRDFILQNEWLASMPQIPLESFAMLDPKGELIAAAVFGAGNGILSKHVCGEKYARQTVCLERGACAHWAHPHAGSYFTAAICKEAARMHGWRVFYAYSDIEAGEVGTIYQACNWLYLGQAPGRSGKWRYQYTNPQGERVTSRTFRRLGLQWPVEGWTRRRHEEKHKYVHFEGNRKERHLLRQALRYPVLPYPKRSLKEE
jgi:hypothetical protein